MKSLFGAVIVLALVLLTGGLYYKMRSTEKKTSDWQRVKDAPGKVSGGFKAIGRYFSALFASKPEAQTAETPQAA